MEGIVADLILQFLGIHAILLLERPYIAHKTSTFAKLLKELNSPHNALSQEAHRVKQMKCWKGHCISLREQ